MRRTTEDPFDDNFLFLMLSAESLVIGLLVLIGVFLVLKTLLF